LFSEAKVSVIRRTRDEERGLRKWGKNGEGEKEDWIGQNYFTIP
jgi:hypothetical protein